MNLHTYISGEGEPILLIHSGGMTGLTEYEEQTEFFTERNYKVIRPDLRGHGKSESSIEHYFEYCADDLLDTINALDMESCHIAGVSLGGIAALLFAKKYPHKVKSLTFSGVFPEKSKNWEESLEEEANYHEELFKNKELVMALNEIHGKSDWKALLRSWATPNWYPFHETGDVSNLKVPTLCMVGGSSENEFSAALSFKRLNPSIHISIIPFAEHLVHREQPELYSQTLFTFLSGL